MYSVSLDEQETVINMQRSSDIAEIYTTDRTMMTKLDRLVNDNPDWNLKQEDRLQNDGTVVSKVYTCPKKLISFRAKQTTRILTDEQKQALRERLQLANSARISTTTSIN